MSDNKSSSGGIGFCGLLTIAFIVLKLCDVITWSWWWVVSPLWIPVALFIAGVIIYAPFWIIKQRNDYYQDFKSNRKSKWQERMEQMQEAQKKTAKHN